MIDFDFNKRLVDHVSFLVEEYEISHIDAVMDFCTKNEIDETMVGEIVKSCEPLLAAITEEAQNLRIIKRIDKLPF